MQTVETTGPRAGISSGLWSAIVAAFSIVLIVALLVTSAYRTKSPSPTMESEFTYVDGCGNTVPHGVVVGGCERSLATHQP